MPAPHPFVWYELMTPDMDAAQAFYCAVIGWSAKDAGQSAMRYTLLSAGEIMVAGIMGLPPEVTGAGGRAAWFGYIGADDVDAATESVHKAGGQIFRPPGDIPNVGRFSVVTDPQGAVFMLFTPKGGGGGRPQVPPGTPGHVGWHELYAGDGRKAFTFYAGEFGWTKADAVDLGAMGVYQLFGTGGAPVGGIVTKPEPVPVPIWLYYFTVEAIDAAVERIKAHGGEVLMGPMEVTGGSWIVQAMDPQGGMFALVARQR